MDTATELLLLVGRALAVGLTVEITVDDFDDEVVVVAVSNSTVMVTVTTRSTGDEFDELEFMVSEVEDQMTTNEKRKRLHDDV